MITNSINSALSGLLTFESKLHETAQNIAQFPLEVQQDNSNRVEEEKPAESSQNIEIETDYSANRSRFDLSTNMVNMMLAQRGYEANLNVLKTAEDLSKSVINILS